MKRIFRAIYWPLVGYFGWVATITPLLYFGQSKGENISLWDAFIVNSLVYAMSLVIILIFWGFMWVAAQLYYWCFDDV